MRDWKRWALAAVLGGFAAYEASAALKEGRPSPELPAVRKLERFRDCPRCPEMVVLPAGSFTMGSDDDHPRERPRRRVTFDRPFAIGVREVTVGEWRHCVEYGACSADILEECETPDRTDDYPVCGPGWMHARIFVAFLSSLTGQRYRLPSEAEWEYAARAGTRTRYWWGDDFVAGRATCRDCNGRANWPTPAGTFPPNGFGLYDVAGNLSEWTEDCWNPTYDGAPTDGSAWLHGECGRRMMRGGSWSGDAAALRSAYRYPISSYPSSGNTRGLRVVRDM